MAYTMKYDGAEELAKLLNRMGTQAQAVASVSLYEGAGVMADEVKAKAEGIRTEPFHYTVFGTREPSPEEKAIVQAAGAVGIAKFEHDGMDVNTSVGYGRMGYANAFGKWKAVAQIANAINSGTSFMKKQPFFRRAVTSGSKKAEARIADTIEANFEAMINKSGG